MDMSLVMVWLSGLAPWVQGALMWLGLLVVVLRAVVKLTPTGKDDALLAKLNALPLVGPFLSGVASKAPLQDK